MTEEDIALVAKMISFPISVHLGREHSFSIIDEKNTQKSTEEALLITFKHYAKPTKQKTNRRK